MKTTNSARSVLITGASRGIGAAVLQAQEPQSLVFAGYRQPRDQLPHAPGRHWIAADLAADNGVDTLLQGMIAIQPELHLDALVLNAGVALPEFWDHKARDPGAGQPGEGDPFSPRIRAIETNILLNLSAPLQLLSRLIENNQVNDQASIVLIGSNLARRGVLNKVAYSAAKAGLEAATRSLAKSLAPRKIRVNTVAPGLIHTDMTAGLGQEFWSEYIAQNPSGRVGTPEDVAQVVQFFLSPAAAYVNGQVLDVDGGWAS